MCVVSPSISAFQRLLNICDDHAAEHEIVFNCNKQLVFVFLPTNYKAPAPLNVFLNGVRVQFFDQVKYLRMLLNASLKDYNVIQRQVKSQYCAANKFQDTFDQCFPAVKHSVLCLLHANVCLPIVEQIHTD